MRLSPFTTLSFGTNSRSFSVQSCCAGKKQQHPTLISSQNTANLLFFFFKKTKKTAPLIRVSAHLCFSLSARNILYESDCMPPPPPFSQWACGISPSHSLADWVIPSDFLQMCSSIRFLTAWDWDIAFPPLHYFFFLLFFVLTNMIFFPPPLVLCD